SGMITGQQMSQLSTNGRSMYSLISLTPGASSGQADFQIPTPVGGDANVSFNGLRESHNLYLLDGSESSDRGGAGGSDVMPSMDSLAEFRTMTSNYSAEFGLSSAATFSAVIKSGTRQFHASAWEFLRNNALDARNYFNRAPAPVAELRFNTYGFNAGGPVDFWRKEHKTFFFYNMEWRSLIQGQTLNQLVPLASMYPDAGGAGSGAVFPVAITVPSAAAVAPSVLFQNCTGGAPAGVVQGQPFPNNTIPDCMISPSATALVNAGIFPAPTGPPGPTDPLTAAHFIGGNNVPTHVREEIVRIDHNFSSKFSVYGHFVAEQIAQNFGTAMWSGDNLPTASNTFGNPSYSAVVHTTYVISPTLLNEVAFNYNGNRIAILPTGIVAQPSGFSSQRIFSGPNNDNRIPEIHLSGTTTSDYTTASWPWNNKADDYQIRDDVSWTKGAHQFRMGGSWALYKKVQDLFGNTQGSFNFDGSITGSNDFADFLLGDAKSYGELGVQDSGYWNNVSWAAYIQDNWRATKRLTLNLGLRWDGVPHTYEANDRMGNFYPNLYQQALAPTFVPGSNGNSLCAGNNNPAASGCTAASAGLGPSPNPILANTLFYLNGIGVPGTTPGVPKGLVQNHWAAFGPRIGFAYDLFGNGKTVLRGGFGTMYERIQGNDMYNAGPNPPFSTQVNFNNVTLVNPSTGLASGNTLVAPITVASITGLSYTQNKLPVSNQYSIGVQHALTPKTVLNVTYVGNQNRHQNDYREMNAPNQSALAPLFVSNGTGYNLSTQYLGFNSIKLSEDVQNSHYNGLQASVRSQIKDLTLDAGYTLSKAVDPATSGNGVSDLNNVSNPYSYTYDNGPSGLDRTNIFYFNWVYDIPLLKNSSSKLMKSTLGGWQVSGVVAMVSGAPLNITEGGIPNCMVPGAVECVQGTANISSIIPNANNRPMVTGSVGTPHTVNSWLANGKVTAIDPTTNKAYVVSKGAFSPTPAGVWGNTPFNSVRGPGRDNWNLALFKTFAFNERGSRLEFRTEFFNIWNHTQFNNVSSGYQNGDFGQVTSTHDPRVIQFGLKLYY
ncbi:MAG: TonB-dependent receptor, partial [Candidatus Sulfotelmatobacter sp.]